MKSTDIEVVINGQACYNHPKKPIDMIARGEEGRADQYGYIVGQYKQQRFGGVVMISPALI